MTDCYIFWPTVVFDYSSRCLYLPFFSLIVSNFQIQLLLLISVQTLYLNSSSPYLSLNFQTLNLVSSHQRISISVMLVTWLSIFFFSLSLSWFFFNSKYLLADINFPTKRRNRANLWAQESINKLNSHLISLSLSLSLGKGGCCNGSGCDLWVWLVFVIYEFGLC